MSHIAPLSFKVAATLAAYRVVTIASTTANTVGYPEANTKLPVGITVDTVKDTVNAIPVACYGVAKLYFNDTCAVGSLVAADSSGRGVPFVAGAATTTAMTIMSAYIGMLVGPAVAATGTIAEVLIKPGFHRGTS